MLQATGPIYSAYNYHFKRPVADVLAGYDAKRQAFLKAVFDASKKGRVWDHLEPAVVAEALGEPRERIVAAVTYLEEQGDLEVQVTGLRHGFRRVGDPDAVVLSEALIETFLHREAQDIVRLNQVVAFAEHGGCLTRHLLHYFGEDLETDCGHCDGCVNPEPRVLPRSPKRALGDVHRDVVVHVRDEGHEALQHPRQLARFLCGLTSPATSRARLSRHPRFGCFAELSFADVLDFVVQI